MKNMMKMTALAIVLIVFGSINVGAQVLTVKADPASSHPRIKHIQLPTDYSLKGSTSGTRSKTLVGTDSMCLALDLRKVELSIAEAMIVPEKAADVLEALDLLYYHLEDTEEGEILFKLKTDEQATLADYIKVMVKVESSLQNRLTDEAHWAFNVGLVLWDLHASTLYGDIESFSKMAKELDALVEKADGYANENEITILAKIAASSEINEWSEEDYISFYELVDGFINLYFQSA